MKVMFVSQCTKKALVETRRIIDQFAERKGDCVWQTNITKQGLETVRKLLKATARRNTAVTCHLFRGRQQTEILWIVGNIRKFNLDGSVPTNITRRDILRVNDENDWHTGEAIAILASIAGLFHDFGKANELFQSKLKRRGGIKHEPFRHEWISLLLFGGFVGKSSEDKEWIERLSRISTEDKEQFLKNFPDEHNRKKNPLRELPKLAMFIGWLILSHHRLPVLPKDHQERPRFDNIDKWMEGKRFSALWNSYHCNSEEWESKHFKQVGTFPLGTPCGSETWCAQARKIAMRALKYYHLLERDWFQDRFSMHLMRAALMLSDHFYSAGSPTEAFQEAGYKAYANTEKGSLKQKLDEHNIGVAKNALLIAKSFSKLRDTLPSIRHKGFKKRSKDVKFAWQDKAYDLAYEIKKNSRYKGFFGVNLASTGCGKTLANARIMYGLSNEARGCRFSVALGLRVLTLQTGEALQKRLSLENDDVAVMIGSREFQQLHELNNENGLESSESLFDELDYVSYEGSLDDGPLSRWLSSNSRLHKLVSAPILVCTIDHLIPVTEGCRGGKQIAPLLRFLTSDLVIDEPDDFDVSDLPALCRLVNFAGVFGANVLLSSATLPPAIVKALFEAYFSGRMVFNDARGKQKSTICCAWFDEFRVSHGEYDDSEYYISSHSEFVEKRIAQLRKQVVLRRASLVPIDSRSTRKEDAVSAIAQSIRTSLYHLHDKHHQAYQNSDKKISIGLVRMANIDPMVSVVKSLLSEKVKSNYCIHFCVYHSRFPLLVRSKIEEVLDRTLSRKDPDKIWDMPEISSALSERGVSNHIFVVFATSVAEVGRDHDYDWAVIEPSSMRSIIQLAGRVQRHRQIAPSEPNLMILQKNMKGLIGSKLAFNRPGFETMDYQLETKDLKNLLHLSQYEIITAIPRLHIPKEMDYSNNLVSLEHTRLKGELLESNKSPFSASLWWKHNAHWCGELQHQSQFRKKEGIDRDYLVFFDEGSNEPKFYEWPDDKEPIPVDRTYFERDTFTPSQGIHRWVDCVDLGDEIEKLADRMNLSLRDVCLKFTRFRLRQLNDGKRWNYHPVFGFYQSF
ncbi:MAG: type I-F CRISPR-associated helicase Cas3f [Waddliaceae bacterium]